jgi:hypothetical protein
LISQGGRIGLGGLTESGKPVFVPLDRVRINCNLDDTLWLRRAHSIGCGRQLLNMITYALGVNALSMHVHRHRIAPPQAA